MSRKTEFRVWDDNQIEWVDSFWLDEQGNVYDHDMFIISDAILSEYTGQKDKNGTEIYEGDIIKYAEFVECIADCHGAIYQEYHAEVVFRDGRFEFDGMWSYGELWHSLSNTEVIGNIYENPELLKEEL